MRAVDHKHDITHLTNSSLEHRRAETQRPSWHCLLLLRGLRKLKQVSHVQNLVVSSSSSKDHVPPVSVGNGLYTRSIQSRLRPAMLKTYATLDLSSNAKT